MKTSVIISAPCDATVRHIRAVEGQIVQQGSPLLLLE